MILGSAKKILSDLAREKNEKKYVRKAVQPRKTSSTKKKKHTRKQAKIKATKKTKSKTKKKKSNKKKKILKALKKFARNADRWSRAFIEEFGI